MGGSASQAQRLPFAREAAAELTVLTLALTVAVVLLSLLPGWLSGASLAVVILAWAGSLFFFRDPWRQAPPNPSLFMAPADGKVLEVEQVDEPQFISGAANRVAIFMSMLDVHVNRSPSSGTVRWVQHHPGKHLQAFRREAAQRNEHNLIGLEAGTERILIKQVAGIMARRIACSVQPGQRLMQGERLGIIKLGSRVELFLPPSTQVLVAVGDRVRAGLTPIARKA